MEDSSATAALDAYLERQSLSHLSSASQNESRRRQSTDRMDLENTLASKNGRRSALGAEKTRQPLQESRQVVHRHSSLKPLARSKGRPAHLAGDTVLQSVGSFKPDRIRAVWPPSPLDEKDETPLLSKLHPATQHGHVAPAGARKSSTQALQRLKRTSSAKPVAQQEAADQHKPINSRGAVQASTELTATQSAAQRPSTAAGGSVAAQAAEAPKAVQAGEPAAPQTWRKACWDASLYAEDTRMLDSLIPQQPSQTASTQRSADTQPTAGLRIEGRAAAQPAPARPGQPAGSAHDILRRNAAPSGHKGAAEVGGGRGPPGGSSEAHGGSDGASLLAEVLAELRAQEEDSSVAEPSPLPSFRDGPKGHQSAASGAAGDDATHLAQAAMEEASALDAVVSWYHDVQRKQIDARLAGDPAVLPAPALLDQPSEGVAFRQQSRHVSHRVPVGGPGAAADAASSGAQLPRSSEMPSGSVKDGGVKSGTSAAPCAVNSTVQVRTAFHKVIYPMPHCLSNKLCILLQLHVFVSQRS